MAPNFERLLKVLNLEQPDRVPLYEHLVDSAIMEDILGRPAPALHEGSRDSKKSYMRYLVDFFQGMGFDYVPIEVGMKLFRINTEMSYRNEPLGRTSRSWVDNSRSTIANLEEFEEYPWPEPEAAVDYELLEVARDVLPDNMKLVAGVGGGVQEHVLWLVGLRQLSIELHREPAFVKRLFDKIGSLISSIDKVIAAMDHVGALKSGDDMGYKTATLLSPKVLREHAFPWQKRIADIAHMNGKPFILHSCGNLHEIIDDLIDIVGINAWHSFQDVILPVSEAKKKYGGRVALLGGVDVDVLTRASVSETIEYTWTILKNCMPGGGYALGTGNSVTNYIRIENYKAMIDTGKKYGKYS
nr:uroporphyrinogen decarboxylase family protein [Candidatus Sigynarchaeota archaeon]